MAAQKARARFVAPQKCPNCGESMEIHADFYSAHGHWLLFWQCPNSDSDDSCETNGDVYAESEVA